VDKRASYATMIWGVQGSWVNSDLKAGPDTRPLFSSTHAALVSEPFCVQFMTSYDPLIL